MNYDIIKTNANKLINSVKNCENIETLVSMYFSYVPNTQSESNVFYEVLLTLAACNMGEEAHIDLLFNLFEEVNLELSELLPSKDLWRYCLNLDNYVLLKRLLEKGYKLSSDGNIVRHAVYANKLDIAELLLKNGYQTPETLTMFAVSNQLGWDPIRVKFLLKHGTVFTIDEKEQAVLDILKDKESYTIVKLKKKEK